MIIVGQTTNDPNTNYGYNHLIHPITENYPRILPSHTQERKNIELFITARNSIHFRNCILCGVISDIHNIPVRIAERLMMIDSLKTENEPEHFLV